jgi:2',3'-cyclic-nucleotide 2'-phosphodiesterase (5'-nucleotidase family)
VAASVSGIDFIIGGHDHFLFEQPISVPNPGGKQTLIFQAGEFYKYIGKLTFTVTRGVVTVNDYRILSVDSSVPAELTVQGTVDYLKSEIVAQYGDVYHTIVGRATHDLDKHFDPVSPLRDTPIGNLVTDSFRKKTRTNVALTVNGLISEKIYAGPIVGADVFRSLSYGFDEATGLGFNLATFEIRGTELLKGLEICLAQIEYTDDFNLQVSGMKFRYNSKRPAGQRVIPGSIRIDEKPFKPHAKYTATVNSGIAYLLSSLGVQVENLRFLSDLEYLVVKDYIARLGRVNYQAEGRIRDRGVICNHKDLEEEEEIAEEQTVPETVFAPVLSQSYPNPFNPSTTISYTLPVNGIVMLKIYNSLGQEVVTLINGQSTAGTHEVVWDASKFASGVYFYRLQTASYTETKKMYLLK